MLYRQKTQFIQPLPAAEKKFRKICNQDFKHASDSLSTNSKKSKSIKMKSIILAITLAFSLATLTTNALDNKTINSILKTFRQQHEKATDIQWKAAEEFLVIEFKEEGQKNYAYYNQDSEMIVLAQSVSLNELNAQLQKDLKKLYPDHTIADVFKMKDKNGTSFSAVAVSGNQKVFLKSSRNKWTILKKNTF
jgi:hypothetical protein